MLAGPVSRVRRHARIARLGARASLEVVEGAWRARARGVLIARVAVQPAAILAVVAGTTIAALGAGGLAVGRHAGARVRVLAIGARLARVAVIGIGGVARRRCAGGLCNRRRSMRARRNTLKMFESRDAPRCRRRRGTRRRCKRRCHTPSKRPMRRAWRTGEMNLRRCAKRTRVGSSHVTGHTAPFALVSQPHPALTAAHPADK